MKRIAIIGAPKSGKSDLALEVEKSILGGHPTIKKVHVVDDYIPAWQSRTGMAVGEFGTYIVNSQIALERLNVEEQALNIYQDAKLDDLLLITCGSLIETVVYHSFNSYCLALHNGSDQPSGAMQGDPRAHTTMQWLTLLKADTWKYDKVFYTPLSDELKADEENGVITMVDNNIPLAAEALQIKYDTVEDAQTIIDYLNG